MTDKNQRLFDFLERNEQNLSKEIRALGKIQRAEIIKAGILSQCSQADLGEASEYLHQGELVAFPTETVYGLGANALNREALLKIYKTKKRPLTDPIIVHVLDPSDTEEYVSMTEKERKYFDLLSKKFWPGPLTIILKANLEVLPSVVTAETGYVGIRCPSHPYFRSLLQKTKLPIGAPSANLFSHVSPTDPVHVFNDFYKDPILVVDGGRCEFGVESTVVKVLDDKILVLREGSLAVEKIQSFLKETLGEAESPRVEVLKKVTNESQKSEAPGQLLKHYSPNLPCTYVESVQELKNTSKEVLASVGFISFSSEYDELKKYAKEYYRVGENLTVQQVLESDPDQKYCSKEQRLQMREIYFLLRLLENKDLGSIVVCWSGPKEGTIWDKVFRSTEGKKFAG